MPSPTLPLLAAAFWSGILVEGMGTSGPGMGRSVLLMVAGMGAASALSIGRTRARLGVALCWLVLLGSFAAIGTGWAAVREARVRDSPLAGLAGHGATVVGTVANAPRPGHFGWTATIDAQLVVSSSRGSRGARCSDSLWAEGHGHPPSWTMGDRVQLAGTLTRPGGRFGRFLRSRGHAAAMSVDRVIWRAPQASILWRTTNRLRAGLVGALRRVLPKRDAGLVMGLALGDTSLLDPRIDETFRATGLSHLTAVSGENLAMFLAPIFALAMALRAGRWGRLFIGAAAIGFFCLLTGGEPSVLRAAVMAGLTLLGVFLGRPRSAPAILGAAVLILLATNPTLVHAIGFQLSVAATAGIALLATPLAERLPFLPRWLSLPAGTTIGAQAGVTPLLLYQFGVVPTVSVPANLLAFLAVGPAMLLGLLSGALAMWFPPLGRVVAGLARMPLGYLEGLAETLARSPLPSITSFGGGAVQLLIGVAAVLSVGLWLRSGRRLPPRAAVAAALLVPLFVWAGAVKAGSPSWPAVVFFDVGQGDSALMRSPAGATILIDAGPDPQLVSTKLAALGVRRVDLLVATHPHADHVAGFPAILARFPVGLVLDPGCRSDSPEYSAFLSALRSSGVPARHPRQGSTLTVGDVRVEVLGPERCFHGTDSDPNNDSLVLRVSVGRASVLFTGDVQEQAQADLLRDEAGGLGAVVLKVPHHGGATTDPAFLLATHARVAVVSVGPNRYGHPSGTLLGLLAADGMRVFRTDRSGDVTMTLRGGEVLVTTSG